MKVVAWPHELAVEHWTDEAWNFLSQARGGLERSMIQHFDLERIYEQALRDVRRVSRAHATPPRVLPPRPPFTLEELCDEDFIAQDMIARIRDAAPPA